MRIFGSNRIAGLMQRLGMEEGVPIEHTMVTKAIERAQKQVEAQNFATRKHLLEYDDVMNKQRENVYALRRELLEGQITLAEGETVDTRGYLMTVADDLVDGLVDTHASKTVDPTEWDLDALRRQIADLFAVEPEALDALELESKTPDDISDALKTLAAGQYEEKERSLPVDTSVLRRVERDIMLQIVDQQWKDHLYSLDHLKDGIGLRGYGQRDPLVEYKKESFTLFQAMKGRVDEDMVRYMWRLRLEQAPDTPVRQPARRPPPLTLSGPASAAPSGALPAGAASRAPQPARTGGDDATPKTVRRDEPKVGRNDPCWCGSGKKFKKCHGA
jgi:preprotein translocase subunit SecA